jgi:spore maturation protein CgeB
MRFALFYHSLISDWNHGNAHFLRGMMRALQQLGHQVVCYEQEDNWSLRHLLLEQPDAVEAFRAGFPDLHFERYRTGPYLESWLQDRLRQVDVLVVHEWTDPAMVRLLGRVGRRLGLRTLFHDTHYRVVLDDAYRESLELSNFDLILAYSPSLAERYRSFGFHNVEVLHEAADVTLFGPRDVTQTDDVVFVGNCGEDDRVGDVERFIFEPRRGLPHLRYAMYGVRYPQDLLAAMSNGLNVEFRGRAANMDVPRIYSAAKVVLHVPRRQYVELLPGTPTIRVFEALASGACLVSSPWPDTDQLFTAGRDYALANSPEQMRATIARLVSDPDARAELGRHGRDTILARHTCAHRARQLLDLLA